MIKVAVMSAGGRSREAHQGGPGICQRRQERAGLKGLRVRSTKITAVKSY